MHFRVPWFLLTLILSLFLAVLGIGLILSFSEHGKDAEIFCAAARVSQAGGIPYKVSELGSRLSWNYLPYTLSLFKILCLPPIGFRQSYPLIYAILLTGGVALWKPGPDWLLALALALGGFWAFGWVLLTGNITAIEFLLICIMISLLEGRRWEAAGMTLGIVSSLKLWTIIYVVLLFFIPESNARRWRVAAVALLAFVVPFGLSALLYPHLMAPFFQQLFGLIPGQHNPWMETGELSNLPVAFLLSDAMSLMGINLPFGISAAAIFLLTSGFMYRIIRTHDVVKRVRESYPDFFSVGFLAITIVLPRLKPYSFLLAIPAIFYLVRSLAKRRQSLILAISIILPTVCFFMQYAISGANELVGLLLNYSPTISLLAVFILLVYFMSHPDTRNAGIA